MYRNSVRVRVRVIEPYYDMPRTPATIKSSSVSCTYVDNRDLGELQKFVLCARWGVSVRAILIGLVGSECAHNIDWLGGADYFCSNALHAECGMDLLSPDRGAFVLFAEAAGFVRMRISMLPVGHTYAQSKIR